MDQKYFEQTRIIRIGIHDVHCCGDVILSLINKKWSNSIANDTIKDLSIELDCFLPHSEDREKFIKSKNGDIVLANLSLCTFNVSNPKDKVKNIEYIKPWPSATNHYDLTGEIIAFRENESHQFYAVIDCGFNCEVQTLSNKKPNMGDFIKASGRLNAQYIKKI